MGWAIKLGEVLVDFDDLTPEVFEQIAVDEPENTSWLECYLYPGAHPDRLYRIAVAAAAHAGVDAPEKPASMRAAKELLDALEPTQDHDDKSYVNGFPPTPDEPEAGSTSGSPGSSDGLPMSSDASA